MTLKPVLHLAIGTVLAAGALGAQAATLTFNNWAYVNGNAVNIATPGTTSGAYSGQAGGFSATLAGVPGFSGPLTTYCVEMSEYLGFGTPYGEYTVLSAADYFNDAGKVQTLTALVGYVFGTDLFGSTAAASRDDLSTSLQLAIWNTVYDADITLAGGSVRDTSTTWQPESYAVGAAGYLGANDLLSLSQSGPRRDGYQLYVLQSLGNPGHQDQLFWQAVPEPASLSLAALALGAAGMAGRRRKVAR